MKIESRMFGDDLYISLTCIAKEYNNRYGKVYNISQALKHTHESFYVKTRGAGGRTYFKLGAFESFLNSRQCFPDDFVNDLREFIKNELVVDVDIVKKTACDIVSDYLSVIHKRENVVDNYCYKDEIYGIHLLDKILIKFIRGGEKITPLKSIGGKVCVYFNLDCPIGYELAKLRLEIRNLIY